MRLRQLALAGALGSAVAFGLIGPANASGDYGCQPNFSLENGEFKCASRMVMGPGNDSRVNLLLLARDAAGPGLTEGSYPESFLDEELGQVFFRWNGLRSAYYPAPDRPDADEKPFLGTRCASVERGRAEFNAAMAANRRLPAAERSRLEQGRDVLHAICERENRYYAWAEPEELEERAAAEWPADIASGPGKEFLAYLKASGDFYREDWASARSAFDTLSKARDPWVRETAQYMLLRVDIGEAQGVSFDQWGNLERNPNASRPAITRAHQHIQAYLKAYPKGRYASSISGLARRVLWLDGRFDLLANVYGTLLAKARPATVALPDMVEEIDNKLLDASEGMDVVDNPLLLAAVDLRRMRDHKYEDYFTEYGHGLAAMTHQELGAQQPQFAAMPELYEFLRASYAFHVEQDYRAVLKLLPDAARQASFAPLQFSRQFLRGQALAALGDRNEAGFWRDMIGGSQALYQRPLVELALALRLERDGKLSEIFAPGSPVENSMLRRRLLYFSAGPDILRAQAIAASRPVEERDLALFTLLRKQLSHGRYADFLKDIGKVRSGASVDGSTWWLDQAPLGIFTRGRVQADYACPQLAATVEALARNAQDVQAQLCLGEFWRLNGFDYLYAQVEAGVADGELGSTVEPFPGTQTPRSALYDSIIANPNAPANDKAYALYRAIRCYAPTGSSTCGGEEVPESRRKAWFEQLKTQYANTRWARDLRYYW